MTDLNKTINQELFVSQKYPKTPHVPWSCHISNDDKIAKNVDSLIKTDIVITEKLDGSNCALSRSNLFARSHSKTADHPSFDWLKSFHATIKYKIPEHYQLFCEYLFAKHTIEYCIPSYLFLFNVRDTERNLWLSWKNVEYIAEEIGIPTVPKLYEGSINSILSLCDFTNKLALEKSCYGETREGVVVRLAKGFNDIDFSKSVAKLVSKKFKIDTGEHWSKRQIIKNKVSK